MGYDNTVLVALQLDPFQSHFLVSHISEALRSHFDPKLEEKRKKIEIILLKM